MPETTIFIIATGLTSHDFPIRNLGSSLGSLFHSWQIISTNRFLSPRSHRIYSAGHSRKLEENILSVSTRERCGASCWSEEAQLTMGLTIGRAATPTAHGNPDAADRDAPLPGVFKASCS